MRKIVLLLVLFSIGAIAFSQGISVRFIGRINETNYCRLDSVAVTNITRGWTKTVVYPDTIIVLDGTGNVNLNIAEEQGLGQNIPNPFDCETRVELSVSQRENVRMQLLDASGKQYAEYSGSLDAGVHTFDISAAAPQTYILNATIGNRSYSIRMVNTGSGCGSSIKYAGISGSIISKQTLDNEFQIGDNMRYIGYTNIGGNILESEPVLQPLRESQDVELAFRSGSTGILNGHDWVDLGLPSGTRWATCNVGADSSTAYGDYFAWGETTAKTYYNWSTYHYCNGSFGSTLTKYCTDARYGDNGFTDNLTTLEASDDAATANWGSGWRMPTLTEMQELIYNCTVIWTTINGIGGRQFTGPNGNSIFLPAAGCLGGSELYDWSHYWSSSLYPRVSPNYALCLNFNSDTCNMSTENRHYGQSVRPVCVSATSTTSAPIVTTNSASSVTATGATLSGNVTYAGGATVTARGFLYGINSSNLTQTVQSGSGTGSFTKDLTGLTSGTTYYYKAYATNSEGTAYGELMSFTTGNSGATTGTLNGQDWVDLGLPSGTRWATCNVGASTPTEYGNYYAWGETTTKEIYDWSTYRYCNGSENTITKYCIDRRYGNNGFTDDLTTLQYSDDAATANWGSDWRMPTETEMQELINNCTVTWTTINGVGGMQFTGPNGNSIFLPAAGFRRDSDLINAGSYGYYWSSSLRTDGVSYDATGLLFYSGNYYPNALASRYEGLSVRPVCVSATSTTSAPTVTTNSASSVTATSATISGNVTYAGGATVTARGFLYGTNSSNLTQTVQSGSGTGSFIKALTGLTSGTTYYYKAYATNSAGTAYGEVMSFATESTCIQGTPGPTLTDSRDGNSYSTIIIGNQTWMAENLRYEGSIPLDGEQSSTTAYRYYPDYNSSNVATYGYLYNWPAAMNGASSSSSNPSGVQGICPNGWHLPSDAEWTQLSDYLGGTGNAGAMLAGNASVWRSGTLTSSEYFGSTGFTALPAGTNLRGNVDNFGRYAFFWSATEYDSSCAYSRDFCYYYTYLGWGIDVKDSGFSIRCVRDN